MPLTAGGGSGIGLGPDHVLRVVAGDRLHATIRLADVEHCEEVVEHQLALSGQSGVYCEATAT